jgi:hypothetical protein
MQGNCCALVNCVSRPGSEPAYAQQQGRVQQPRCEIHARVPIVEVQAQTNNQLLCNGRCRPSPRSRWCRREDWPSRCLAWGHSHLGSHTAAGQMCSSQRRCTWPAKHQGQSHILSTTSVHEAWCRTVQPVKQNFPQTTKLSGFVGGVKSSTSLAMRMRPRSLHSPSSMR